MDFGKAVAMLGEMTELREDIYIEEKKHDPPHTGPNPIEHFREH